MQHQQQKEISLYPYPALVSIHDITPETIPAMLDIIKLLKNMNIFPASLFIVPGVKWSTENLNTIRELQNAGYELVCHGWLHECGEKKTIMHKIHGAILSRNAAEHLSRSAENIAELITRGFHWFNEAGLGQPAFYAPPAWAMGGISLHALRELPFKYYEFLTGFYHCRARSFYRLPLVGYEADTRQRVPSLVLMNMLNEGFAHCFSRPLRIAIHPDDFSYLLAESLKSILSRHKTFISYEGAMKKKYANIK